MTLKPTTKERQRQITVVYDPEKLHDSKSRTPVLKKKRVAAYARVSTELDEQQNSYEAQIEYYRGYIQGKPEWEFVGIYADEGISGTSYKKRDGFNRMIEDAMNGKIDLVLTKSISRFSRNTVDSLSVTRQLKAKGVEVYFEKENISSMDAQAELLFTIMSSIAQEESRSISENVRWGKQRSMEAGKVSLAWSAFLGYTKGQDGLPMIVEKEAEIVRQIYRSYLDGKSFSKIAEDLTEQGVKTPKGKKIWSSETIRSILRNEKYKGDARLQKTYIVDFLSKEVRVNNGERKQWYIKDSHDAIVTPETFELVQKEMARRCNRGGGRYDSPFTGNIFCGECGGFYCHCVWHSTSSYRKYVWSCDNKHRSKTNCKTPKVEDYEIEAAFIKVVQRLVSNHESYTEEYERIFLSMIGDTSTLENRLQKASEEYSILMEKVELLIEDNARRSQDQNIYASRFEALNAQLQEKRTELEALKNEITETLIRKENVKIYLAELRKVYPKMNKFDVAAWYRLVEYATVTPEKTIIFHMRDGHDEVIALEEVH